jgi:hypothetical protein
MSPVTVRGYRARGSLAILLPLGFEPLGSRVLRSLFAYRAAALGILFEFLGFGALFSDKAGPCIWSYWSSKRSGFWRLRLA